MRVTRTLALHALGISPHLVTVVDGLVVDDWTGKTLYGVWFCLFQEWRWVMIHAKVLVVDQDQGPYEALKSELARHGYELHTTTTIANALVLAGAHAYQAAMLSVALVPDRTVLDDWHAKVGDVPIILVHAPEHAAALPPQMLEGVTHCIGTPLTLGPVCLVLDRTIEMMSLRAQLRQYRQMWCLTPDEAAVPETPVENAARAPILLEEVLARRLHSLMPSLEVLGRGTLHRALLSHVEKLLVSIVLAECHGNQVKSADILGINRNTLRKKIREFGLTSPQNPA